MMHKNEQQADARGCDLSYIFYGLHLWVNLLRYTGFVSDKTWYQIEVQVSFEVNSLWWHWAKFRTKLKLEDKKKKKCR